MTPYRETQSPHFIGTWTLRANRTCSGNYRALIGEANQAGTNRDCTVQGLLAGSLPDVRIEGRRYTYGRTGLYVCRSVGK